MTDKELKERIIKANEKYMGLVDEFIASVGKKDIAFDDVQNDLCKMLLCLFADWQIEQMTDKACEWIEALNNEHEIMSYTDSHILETDELIQGFKNFIED